MRPKPAAVRTKLAALRPRLAAVRPKPAAVRTKLAAARPRLSALRLPDVSRRTAVTVLALVGVLVVGVPGIGYAAYNAADSGAFVAETTVAGVDVSDITRKKALGAVRSKLSERLDREATIEVGERTYTVTPREMGASADPKAAVGRAYRQSQDTSWWGRLAGTVSGPDVQVPVSDASGDAIDELVQRMVDDARVSAQDATLELRGGEPHVVEAETGRKIERKAARKAVRAALADGSTRSVDVQTVQPDVTADAFGAVIVIDDGSNTLRLYDGEDLVKTYSVAMGQPGHRTPHGRFEVTLKRPSPVWINPAPKGWGKDMPKRVGPGRDSPLGLRALNLNAPGIRIHGTSATGSIGRDASHGCIRLTNGNVLDLYPRVPAGATVFITS